MFIQTKPLTVERLNSTEEHCDITITYNADIMPQTGLGPQLYNNKHWD